MIEFIAACAEADDERDLVMIREQSMVMIGKFFAAEDIHDVKCALLGVLHCVALGITAINLPMNHIRPLDLTIAEARDTLACAWGRTCPPNFKFLMLYSASHSLLRSYELDFEECKLFWMQHLKTL